MSVPMPVMRQLWKMMQRFVVSHVKSIYFGVSLRAMKSYMDSNGKFYIHVAHHRLHVHITMMAVIHGLQMI